MEDKLDIPVNELSHGAHRQLELGITLAHEHDIDVAFSIADQVTVLHHGGIIAEGTPEQIENNRDVQQIYTLSRQSKDSHHA